MTESARFDRGPDGAPTPADSFALLARWNYSLAAFYLRRWRRQLEWPFGLINGTSPADLIEARQAFDDDLMADYRDQVEALHQACTREGGPLPGAYGAELLKAQEHARQLLDQAKAQADRITASAQARAEEIVAAAKPVPPRRSASA